MPWHVMAMFAPSFFTGRLINRFGAERIVGTGLVMLRGARSSAGRARRWRISGAALVLLGLGWNFGFIGAPAMVDGQLPAVGKGQGAGFSRLRLSGSVACASLMSGMVYNAWGWTMLNWMIFPVTLLCFAALGALKLTGLRKAGA